MCLSRPAKGLIKLSCNAAGKLTLAADLGTFIVESDTETSSKLSKEEAALYECLELVGRDISAYLVDGEFSFSGMEQRLVGDGKGHSSLDLTQARPLGCDEIACAEGSSHLEAIGSEREVSKKECLANNMLADLLLMSLIYCCRLQCWEHIPS